MGPTYCKARPIGPAWVLILILLVWAALWTIGSRLIRDTDWLGCPPGQACAITLTANHKSRRKPRLYTLFMYTRSKGKGKWERASVMAAPLSQARRMYQDALIYQTLNGLKVMLRPLTPRMLRARNSFQSR